MLFLDEQNKTGSPGYDEATYPILTPLWKKRKPKISLVSQVPFILTPPPPDEPVAPAISRQDEKYKTDVTGGAQDEIGYRQPCIERLAGGEIKRKGKRKRHYDRF